LEFPIQIIIRSKKLNIDDYIAQVEKLGEKQENKLLQEQTFEYAQYVKRLVEYADIMEKEFYVVVPYDPARAAVKANGIQSFFQRLSPKDNIGEIKKRQKEFTQVEKGLNQRMNVVESGLEACGLKTERLNTEQLIKLFYDSYNPNIYRSTKIKDLENTSLQKESTKKKE